MKLYHYEHCPFCQRVRLFLGFKGIPYEKILLSYDDTKTQKKLTGERMLPIFEFDDGRIFNESLDIIREIEMKSPHPIGFIGPVEPRLQWAAMAMPSLPNYFSILLPYYAEHYTAEWEKFPSGAEYFKSSKEKKRGKSFEELKQEAKENYDTYIKDRIEEIIDKVEDRFFIMGPTFSVADCVLAADLSGLRLVPGIGLSEEITSYIERVEKVCRVNLLDNKGE